MEKKIYKTETHLHTAETSHCGKIPAKDLIAAYAEKGYSTVFVSDHLEDYIFSNKLCSGPNDYIVGATRHLRGYYKAKEAGEKYGVTVLMSSELFIEGNDYLLYGIDEDFLCMHPAITDLNIAEIYERANDYGAIIVAAHPFRTNRRHIMEFVHGVEVVNAADKYYHINQNHLALQLAESMPHLLRTSGSDCHKPADIGRGGIITDHKINSAEDYINALKTGNYELIDISPEKAAENN